MHRNNVQFSATSPKIRLFGGQCVFGPVIVTSIHGPFDIPRLKPCNKTNPAILSANLFNQYA